MGEELNARLREACGEVGAEETTGMTTLSTAQARALTLLRLLVATTLAVTCVEELCACVQNASLPVEILTELGHAKQVPSWLYEQRLS